MNRVGRIFACGLSLFLAACVPSSGDIEELLPAPTVTPAAVASYLDINRPLLSYLPTQREAEQMWRIKGKLLAECYSTPTLKQAVIFSGSIPDPIYTENAMSSFIGPFVTMEDARKYGYHGMDFSITSATFTFSPGVNVLDEGCSKKINSLLPENGIELDLLGNLPNGGPRFAMDDIRVKPIIDEWAGCMQGYGFDISNPRDLRSKYLEVSTKTPSIKEISAAVADVDCKQETNFVARILAWQLVYDEDYIDKNRAALEKRRQDIKDFIAKYS